ncbi:putative addiction module component, TIGR02574 family [Paramicrobacterium humi]|uniref:Putative addiction module component, TIGR02574 family n=1 Tax=Paramicrobacterium humi TaxID=640635 RepID=A0A1H4LMY7_9MICO|nr:addiction module protein [Microbacterium humi]SEB71645.1 putative addiction module component, TIGR02574 family [Microbacterium humi]
MTLSELIEKARELAPADRVALAYELLDSVEEPEEPDPIVDAAWQKELRRRIEDIESGRVQLVDGRETMRIARERIAERRARQGA